MNYYQHHIGDELKKTMGLSPLQYGLYRRMVDWYYANEAPLPLDHKQLCKIAHASTPNERLAAKDVVVKFFVKEDDGWHSMAIDIAIAQYYSKDDRGAQKRELDKLRVTRYRNKRKTLISELKKVGAQFDQSASITDLLALCDHYQLGVDMHVSNVDVTHVSYKRHGHTHYPVSNTVVLQVPADAETKALTDSVGRQKASHEANGGDVVKSQVDLIAMDAVRRMRIAGLQTVNAADPRLRTLLQAGITPHELAAVAAEASVKGKPAAWVYAAIAGRRSDAAIAQSAKDRKAADEMARWAPSVAAMPRGP